MKENYHLVGGFNPFEKYARQIGSSSPSRGENKQKIETTTSKLSCSFRVAPHLALCRSKVEATWLTSDVSKWIFGSGKNGNLERFWRFESSVEKKKHLNLEKTDLALQGGPPTRYNLGEITPITRVKSPQLPNYKDIYRGPITPFITGSGAHLVPAFPLDDQSQTGNLNCPLEAGNSYRFQ